MFRDVTIIKIEIAIFLENRTELISRFFVASVILLLPTVIVDLGESVFRFICAQCASQLLPL